MILIGSQTPHRSSPAIGRLFRPLLVAFALALFVTAFSDAHAAPSFEQQYEKAKQDMEFLKSDSKRGGWREPWEKLAQSFFDLHEKYPRWRNRPAALFRSALAMEELAKRSMLRQDAQSAVDRYGVFLKSYAGHVLADDALFGIARIKAERFNDFSGLRKRSTPSKINIPGVMSHRKPSSTPSASRRRWKRPRAARRAKRRRRF